MGIQLRNHTTLLTNLAPKLLKVSNRAIKRLKWQAYGNKNMAYFALKIMQKIGYLNHKYGPIS